MRSTVLVFCNSDNYVTCPRLKRTESPHAARPFYIIDEDHPRGVVFLNEDELLALPRCGANGDVKVYRENPDVLIVDAFDNRIAMSEMYFNQLCDDILSGKVAAAMSA